MTSTSTLSLQLFFLRIAYIKAYCFLFRAYLKWVLINVRARPPPIMSEMEKASHHFKNVSHFHPGWAVKRERKQVGRRGERIICGCRSECSWLMPDYSCSWCLCLRFSLTDSHTHTSLSSTRPAGIGSLYLHHHHRGLVMSMHTECPRTSTKTADVLTWAGVGIAFAFQAIMFQCVPHLVGPYESKAHLTSPGLNCMHIPCMWPALIFHGGGGLLMVFCSGGWRWIQALSSGGCKGKEGKEGVVMVSGLHGRLMKRHVSGDPGGPSMPSYPKAPI